ncbi:hypothetical protein K491DRAFT_685068 [Lophiostoma macrostomum CBS 122681]|uniref:DUF7924 domain-containing protein n=1 Tax=Lophiostoma macrostomum CBS 122681 TaxID=1314788 RepID=A0A6A6SJR4_9PLEO|nr:hypothetical protein K491DRAFT_685068 [Lophiostoma macrostomum CBS 122681]
MEWTEEALDMHADTATESDLESTSQPENEETASKLNPHDEWHKLRSFHIYTHPIGDIKRAIPVALEAHINAVLRKGLDEPSPAAKVVTDVVGSAFGKNKATAKFYLVPILLYKAVPAHGIVHHWDFDLSQEYLPSAPNTAVGKRNPGGLAPAQPDTILGYDADLARDDDLLFDMEGTRPSENSFSLSENNIHFPWFTSQWTTSTGEPHDMAILRGARDGACIVNYLHEYYETAYKRPATPLEAHHISFTTDVATFRIWVHWREEDQSASHHYMKCILKGFLSDERDVSAVRRILDNLLTYAVGYRLRSIKDALPHWSRNVTQRA